ncbi:hypothetical protein FLL45_14680 [Aliikangiella marina]|uniref:Uncharacterized protein n=1 Tax=Aliikangiella marina TaxID=1712262 RepID=A0A545TA54_9GAMM|nr:hypothetical protein [Aliikangiella marina]TQV74099.1 hypothetical protein FLL45_14680 [Aliikangiella marina]
MKIVHIFRFEKLRDGGSLIVSFQSDDSCEYWVMFPVANLESNLPKFKNPVLVNRTTGIEVELSRMGAKQWLNQLAPLFYARDELPHVSKYSEKRILGDMLALCDEST